MNPHQRRIIELLRSKPAPKRSVRVQIKGGWRKFLLREATIVKPAPRPAPIVARAAKIDGWNYETETSPPIRVEGYRFVKDKHHQVIARCERCWLGFTGDWPKIKPRMVSHHCGQQLP